jgi:alpha-galactosidase
MPTPDYELPAFSFVYGGRDSAEALPAWERDGTPGGARVTYADPETGLRVTVHIRRFDHFPGVDWVLEFENAGDADTPILERVLPLDLRIAVPDRERVRLHHANGSLCRRDDFLPQLTELRPGTEKRLAPIGGRPSNGVLPFMNLQRAGGGMVFAVGWSGQWAAEFGRDGQAVRATAGMEHIRLRLRPGERIRTPRILALPWAGDDPIEGSNLLRRLLLAHYVPRIDGEPVTPPVAQCLQGYFYLTGRAGEEYEMKALPKAARAGADAYWIDACWYGRGGEWWQEVGSWTVNRDRFPNGLKPISDVAHERGMKFVLWFEPERVRPGSELHEDHPEFLLSCERDPDNFLLDLGNAEAREWITDRISRLIRENGVDVYRQDFNFDPLPYWQQADEPDRTGMAEIRHVEGHYAFWDELRRRHPGLWIDNCASGGRRIDLETLSRSLPLWPSDYFDVVGLRDGPGLHVGTQCITSGLARWVPLFGGGLWSFTPYCSRGRVLSGFTFGFHIAEEDYPSADDGVAVGSMDVLGRARTVLDDDFPLEQAKLAIAEQKSLRPFFTGDFYPLLPLTISDHDWCAFQLHREDLGAGFALYFRRHGSPFEAMTAGLRGISAEHDYEISLSPDYEEAERNQVSGTALAGMAVAIPDRPGSLLLRYRRL